MRCPDIHFLWISCKNFIGFTDLNIYRAVPAALTGMNISTKAFGDDMKAKADAKNGQSQIKIFGAVPCPFNSGSPPKDNPAATFPNRIGRRCIGDQRCIDVKIPQCPVDEMIELSEIIDNVYRKHCYISFFWNFIRLFSCRNLQLIVSVPGSFPRNAP